MAKFTRGTLHLVRVGSDRRNESRFENGAASGRSAGIECAPLTERWQSGRMYLTRNQAMSQDIRGFESHPLRHKQKRSSHRGPFLF